MKRFTSLFAVAALLLAFVVLTSAPNVQAQNAQHDNDNAPDADGDGINDNAPDADGDGIPNGMDEDFVRPENSGRFGHGAGNGAHGFIDENGDGFNDNALTAIWTACRMARTLTGQRRKSAQARAPMPATKFQDDLAAAAKAARTRRETPPEIQSPARDDLRAGLFSDGANKTSEHFSCLKIHHHYKTNSISEYLGRGHRSSGMMLSNSSAGWRTSASRSTISSEKYFAFFGKSSISSAFSTAFLID